MYILYMGGFRVFELGGGGRGREGYLLMTFLFHVPLQLLLNGSLVWQP